MSNRSRCSSSRMVLYIPNLDEGRDITHVRIEHGVTTIPNYAFRRYKSLQFIQFPTSLIDIGMGSFLGCQSIQSINLQDCSSLEEIPDYTFQDCKNLTSIQLPNSLTRIGANAFSRCIKLFEINLPESITDLGENSFYFCKRLSKIHIPPSLTHLKAHSFANCNEVRSVQLHDNLLEIGWGTFLECTSLQSIQIPPSTTIVDDAFLDCTCLQIAYVSSESLEEGQSVFYNCDENLILLTDVYGLEYGIHPTLCLDDIRQCLADLPHEDIPRLEQKNALYQAMYHRHPRITDRAQKLGLTLLHLLVYFPNDIYQPLSDLIRKCPQTMITMDNTGKTPFHHVITSTRENMDMRCYDLLVQHTPYEIVHQAIQSASSESKTPWHEIMNVIKAKISGLRIEDTKSGLLPFMIAAEESTYLDLTAVYELLSLQPDVLKKYTCDG